jgi:hypothetical protein
MVVDEAQRHEDATRPEPANGATRVEWIKSRLKSYLRDPVIYQMCSREETATGRALSRFFTDYLDIKTILHLGHLSDTQKRILALHYGPDDLPIADVARRLNLHYTTVYQHRHAALEYLIRVYYDEPTYVLPRRRYVRDDVA